MSLRGAFSDVVVSVRYSKYKNIYVCAEIATLMSQNLQRMLAMT